LPGSHLAFASKVNVNLPDNWKQRGLPTIQGVVMISDAKDGRPLAIMESIALTGIRTAATAALEHFPLDVNQNSYRGFPRTRKSDSDASDGNGGGGRWRRDTRTICGSGW
jgi:hypothetical protein